MSLTTFQAPSNWLERAGKRVEPVSKIEITVPHPHDLILSKLVAGRPKDFEFATRTHQLFPMSAPTLARLLIEFEQAHPNALPVLRQHVQVWQSMELSSPK